MAELITMPKLGFDMREGKLGEWSKQVGEAVAQGETIVLVETDKATVEVPAFRGGVLLQILVPAGDSVPIGAPIGVIGAAGEKFDPAALGLGAPAPAAKPAAVEKPAPAPTSGAPVPVAAPAAGADADAGRLIASPVALRMAAELGLDLRQVAGSGPGGRVIKRDIEAFVKDTAKAPAAQAAPPPMPIPSHEPSPEGYRTVALTPMRQAIARRMVESKTSAPHFYVTSDVDMAAAMALRAQLNALLPEEAKISVNDLIVKACAGALRAFPNVNAAFAGNEIRLYDQVHIALAVARENGLVTAVLRDCDRKSLAQLSGETRELVARARDGKMRPDDMMGGTFTISNLGMFDVENFIAIVSPTQAAILAVGSVKQVPVVKDGQLAVGTRLKITISADHRVTDGAEAARFLQAVKAALEQPLRLLL